MARFVIRPARFDKRKDRHEVDQFGFVDLHKAFENGVVEGNAQYDDDSYNRADPTALLHRPHDMFEAMRQADYVKSSLSAATADATTES